jgi:hypothetical protein
MARPLPGDHYESYQAYIDETTGDNIPDLKVPERRYL